MLPDDERARRLRAQTFTLAEFLSRQEDYAPPHLDATALLHGHCHQKALIGLDAERALLERMGVAVDVPDSGCCGMAGSFGFERDRYAVSMQVGERVLLPAVRNAPDETLLIADGFSCREQVAQATGRRPSHLAEILQRAAGPVETAPAVARSPRRRVAQWALGGAAALVAGALWRSGIRSAPAHRRDARATHRRASA
jgi:Fe-S oxidoreductase